MPVSSSELTCTRCGLRGSFDVCPRCDDVNVRVSHEDIVRGTSPGPRPQGLDPTTLGEYVGRRRAADAARARRIRNCGSQEGADWS